MSGRRTIVVEGREWKYKIGKSFVVAKAVDTGEGRRISIVDLMCHIPSHEIDRMQHKKTLHITPRDIEVWLWDTK